MYDLKIMSKFESSIAKIDKRTKSYVSAWEKKKGEIEKSGVDAELYNALGDIAEKLDNARKTNEEERKVYTSVFDAVKKELIEKNEKPLLLIYEEIKGIRSEFIKKKLEKEEEERKEQEKEALNKRLRTEKEIEFKHYMKSVVLDSSKVFASIEAGYKKQPDEEKDGFLKKYGDVNNFPIQKFYDKAVSGFDYEPIEKTVLVSLEAFKEFFISTYKERLLEFVDTLKNGYSAESIIKETEEDLNEAKRVLEEEKFEEEIKATVEAEATASSTTSQNASHVSKQKKYIAKRQKKSAYMEAFSKYLTSQRFNPSKLDFLFTELLKDKIEISGVDYDESIILSKNSRIK